MRYNFGISAAQYDPQGAFVLPLYRITEVNSGRRRQQITATLDGFVSPFDNGFTFAGIDMLFVVPYTDTNRQKLDYVLRTYATVHLSTKQGFFRAAPLGWKHVKNEIQFRTKILKEITCL